MAKRIEGITIELGGDTVKLNKALASVNKEIGSTQSQLRDVEKLLKLDPSNAQLLEQKQRLLGKAIGDTTLKLESLKEAEKQVQQQFERGDVSQEQYEGLQREIIATSMQLDNLKASAQGVDSQVEKISGAPLKSLGNEAQDAKTKLEKLADAASDVKGRAEKVADGMRPVTLAVAGLATAAVATVPATQELRSDLSKLDQNAKENGVSVDVAREAWKDFAIQSGETDSAIEATSNLLQAGFTESNLQKAVEGLAGAAQRFPDTLKVESLADSLQETLSTGEATGQFGELLDRLGIGAENFSAQLQNCATDAQKQNLALQTLANAGLMDTYKAWVENNQAMIDNQDAALDMQEQVAEFAETIQPLVTTALQGLTELLKWFNQLPAPVQGAIGILLLLAASISPIASGIAGISGAIGFLSTSALPALGTAAGAIPGILSGVSGAVSSFAAFIVSNPIALIVAAVVALVALIAVKGDEIQGILQRFDDWLQGIFSTDWREIFGPVLGGYLNTFLGVVKDVWDGVYQVLDGFIDLVRGVFTGDWERAWKGVQKIFSGIWDSFEAIAKAPLNGIIGLVNMAIDGINTMIDKFNSIKIELPDWLGGWSWSPDVPNIPNIPKLARGTLSAIRGLTLVGEQGPELVVMGGGERVFTAGQTRSILQNSSATTIGGGNVSIGSLTINPTAAQWSQLMQMMGQWQGARQGRRAK